MSILDRIIKIREVIGPMLNTGIMIYIFFVFYGVYCIKEDNFAGLGLVFICLTVSFFFGTSLLLYMKIQSAEILDTNTIFPQARVEAQENISSNNVNRYVIADLRKKYKKNLSMCLKCMTFKAPRTYHCDYCNKCYLRYDHHYFFLATCITFEHYKIFFQYLNYTFVFAALTATVFIVEVSKNLGVYYNIIYGIAIGCLMIIFIYSGILVVKHWYLILHNETSIEYKALNTYIKGGIPDPNVFLEGPLVEGYESKDRKILNPYNLGAYNNWKEIMGDNWYDWFIPTSTTKGDGLEFPKSDWEEFNVDSVRTT